MIKRIVFTLMALVLLPAGVVLVLELLFGQWLWADPWAATRRLNLIRSADIRYAVDHISGHTEPVVRYTRDEWGLRGPCAPGDVQILTLGGSTTDQRLIADGQTWQDVIAQREQARSGRAPCIANAGVDGHSTFGHLASFDLWLPLVPGLKPRHVVLYIGLNDVGRLTPQHGYDDTLRSDETPFQRAVREKSALFELWNVAEAQLSGLKPILPYAGHQKAPPPLSAYTATQPSPDIDLLVARNAQAFEERLQRLMERIGKMGARPVCMSQPHRYALEIDGQWRGLPDALVFNERSYNGLDYRRIIQALNPVMARVCAAHGGVFIDAQTLVLPASDFYDPMHMTPAGARRLGEFLHGQWIQQGILDVHP